MPTKTEQIKVLEEEIMTEQEFITTMKEEILDTDTDIAMDTVLSNIEEWDSLAFVSFIVIIVISLSSILHSGPPIIISVRMCVRSICVFSHQQVL